MIEQGAVWFELKLRLSTAFFFINCVYRTHFSEAYEVLGDEDKRKQYDAYGTAGAGK